MPACEQDHACLNKALLDDMAPRNPKAAATDPKIFVDPSFVQEMENTGFITLSRVNCLDAIASCPDYLSATV